MIALLLTFFIGAYLLGPDLLSRWVLGFVCQRRNIVQTKSEELTRAIAWAIVPLGLAIWWAHGWGTLQRTASTHDWKIVFSGLYSESYFEKHRDDFFHAASAVYQWNKCLLWRIYLIVLLFWFIVDCIIYNYGRIRHSDFVRKHRWINRIMNLFIIPRVSEWHVFLSTMLTEKDVKVRADVLTNNNVLYQGIVAEKMLGSDGSLDCITLAEPSRFQRDAYLEAKKVDPTISPTTFWKKIPSNVFVIMATEITSLNLRHSSPSAVAEDPEILEMLSELLKAVKRKP